MRLLRNPEARHTAAAYILLSAAAVVTAFIISPLCGVLMSAVCAAFYLIWYFSTRRRYADIERMAQDIDRILHGCDGILFDECSEGELSLLSCELSKMTVRLREQSVQLREDKRALADSLADISHQIRTPLTSINLLVSFLSAERLDNARRLELTAELYSLLSRIDGLITSLLRMSKLEAGTVEFKRETLSLSELLDRAAEPMRVPAELREQELEITADGCFYGDVFWSCEALGNIIKNCVEHTPEGGKIRITAHETPIYSEIVISDNGSGISPDDLPHIFERFYKGRDSGNQGYGIGLALARMIITMQSGTVKAENLQSGGACFTLRFYKTVV